MLLKKVHIKGFRNFKDVTVNLQQKTLVIGPNDIGKSNLVYALRILLDRSLSDLDLELVDSDFYAYEETNEISITAYFEDMTEDCIRSRMRENINEKNESVICYRACKDTADSSRSYKIFAGKDEKSLTEYDSRFYLRAFNLNYIDSSRDLHSFIRREKKSLLSHAKDSRTETETERDIKTIVKVEKDLEAVNKSIGDLSYIAKATVDLNLELTELSVTNSNIRVEFDTGATDTKSYVDNLSLYTKFEGKTVALGGDGRNNQVYLALWAARQGNKEDDPTEVSINCIEEPEAHLHPHQQRRLAKYLTTKLPGQVLLTSHSPQIACEFEKNCIVSLFNNNHSTLAAQDGCSAQIADTLSQFGHRLNVIPAEGFFSSVTFLVEGVSEVLFYKALASEIGIDLDRQNISIVPVEGVGFDPFVQVYKNLGIQTVIRTDLDIVKVPRKAEYRVAGLSRLITLQKEYSPPNEALNSLLEELGEEHKHMPAKQLSSELEKLISCIRQNLYESSLFLSKWDLEWDLVTSPIQEELLASHDAANVDELYLLMCESKGKSMFSFLEKNLTCLKKLEDDDLVLPLMRCVDLSNQRI